MSWLSRLVNVIRRDRVDRDLEEEMRFHLAARTDDLVRDGMPAEDAQAPGPPAIRQHAAHAGVEPRHQAAAAAQSILRDVGFGLRLCLRNKTVTAAAVLSLSLAIGACTAAFSLIDALILRPYHCQRSPVADLHRLCAYPGATPGRPQLQLSPLRPTAGCEPGAGAAVRPERPIEEAMPTFRTAAGGRRRYTGNGSQEMRSRFSA